MNEEELDPDIEYGTHDLNDLAQAVREATAQIDSNRKAMEDRIRASHRKMFVWKVGSIIAAIVGIIGLIAGGLGITAANKAQDAIELSNSNRDEARLVSCNEDNKGRQTDFQQTIQIVSPEAVASVVEEGQQQRLLDYLAPVRPLRLCDLESITAYYESGGVEGVEPINWPPHIAAFLDEYADDDVPEG